jgi:hypothetical protein
MQRDVRAGLDGALGGALGTATMSLFMAAAHRSGMLGTPPPAIIADAAIDGRGDGGGASSRNALALAGHFGFGSAAGVLFGLLHRRFRPHRHSSIFPALQGVTFGLLVWAVSYKGWIPALGIMPPPERDRPGRPVTMIVAHIIYGATLGAVAGRR